MSGDWLRRKVRHPWEGGQDRLTMYFVWTGRAVQAGCDDLEIIGLAHLYSARLKGVFCSLAIMDIRAHPISFATRP